MDMVKVKEIEETYRLKAEEENYDNNKTVDILMIASEVIELKPLIGTEADILTWGEFTRRFNNCMKELEALIGN